ncbi:beta-mannosidase [Venturia canescens]|uniref:beta-mannosidase n=1 Tax=Venturia canescens TaxID=32260 RepID=UPI001C9C8004|nr:beta-mannosidase [Venturia canescens]
MSQPGQSSRALSPLMQSDNKQQEMDQVKKELRRRGCEEDTLGTNFKEMKTLLDTLVMSEQLSNSPTKQNIPESTTVEPVSPIGFQSYAGKLKMDNERKSKSPELSLDESNKSMSQEKQADADTESIYSPRNTNPFHKDIKENVSSNMNKNRRSRTFDQNSENKNDSKRQNQRGKQQMRQEEKMPILKITKCDFDYNQDDERLTPRYRLSNKQAGQVGDSIRLIENNKIIFDRLRNHLLQTAELCHNQRSNSVALNFQWGTAIKVGETNGSFERKIVSDEEIPEFNENANQPETSTSYSLTEDTTRRRKRTTNMTKIYEYNDDVESEEEEEEKDNSDEDFQMRPKRPKPVRSLNKNKATSSKVISKKKVESTATKNPVMSLFDERKSEDRTVFVDVSDECAITDDEASNEPPKKVQKSNSEESELIFPRRVSPPKLRPKWAGIRARKPLNDFPSQLRTEKQVGTDRKEESNASQINKSNLSLKDDEISAVLKENNETDESDGITPLPMDDPDIKPLKTSTRMRMISQRLIKNQEEDKQKEMLRLEHERIKKESMERDKVRLVQQRIRESNEQQKKQETEKRRQAQREENWRNMMAQSTKKQFSERTDLYPDGRSQMEEILNPAQENKLNTEQNDNEHFETGNAQESNAKRVSCPICNRRFEVDEIEAHAGACEEFDSCPPGMSRSSSPSLTPPRITRASQPSKSSNFECEICNNFSTENGNEFENHSSQCLRNQKYGQLFVPDTVVEIPTSPLRTVRTISQLTDSEIDYKNQFQPRTRNVTKRKRRLIKVREFEGFVPGGIYTDLMNANLVPDTFKGTNDVKNRWISNRSVTYTRKFEVDETSIRVSRILLKFDGLDTFATIYLNEHEIGKTSNMFLRHVFDVKSYLQIGTNYLNVTFDSAVKVASNLYNKQLASYKVPPECVPEQYNGECHVNHIRKMQASFSWDWGPAVPSMGIWKNVELLPFDDATIIETAIDVSDEENYWDVNVTCLLGINPKASSLLTLGLSLEMNKAYDLEASKEISPSSDSDYRSVSLVLPVPKDQVELWWPNGYGNQTLYTLKIELGTPSGYEVLRKRIGFRKIELVQENLDQGRTFYFKVNYMPIFAKGSNWIPASIYPELSSKNDVVRHLLSSARDVDMNMLRVWGGGYYESDFFYDLADEYGIMIWQDFMFACAMYPTNAEFLDSVREEVRQNVLRLKHHPSIVIWAGNNENEAAIFGNWYGTGKAPIYKKDYVKLYVNVIKEEVEKLDPRRPFVVSSPSDGSWTDDNGFIGPDPYSNLYGDVHYYNYLRNGWNINQYPIPRFASEYGFQSIPAIETLETVTVGMDDLTYGSDFLQHRQHLPAGWFFMKSMIAKNLKIPETNDPHRDFRDFIYLSQINQAVSTKIETESYRQMRSSLNELGEGYTMGALYWQLNDVWQAPSWSSIDFGGNWKMLHYYAKDFFAPIIISPRLSYAKDLTIYIVSDRLLTVTGCSLDLNIHHYNSSVPVYTMNFMDVEIAANSAQAFRTFWLTELLKSASCGVAEEATNNCFVELVLWDEKGRLIAPRNYVFPGVLKNVNLSNTTVRMGTTIASIPGKLSNYLDYEFEVESEGVALFVWLQLPRMQGRFSENGFHLMNEKKKIIFHASEAITSDDLINEIEIMSLSQIYNPNR